MADNSTELKVKLTAEDGISAVIDRVVESRGDTKLGHAVTSVSVAFEAASHEIEIAEHAIESINHAIEETVHAAAEHETAEKKLAAALAVTGNYSADTVEELDKMSVSLAKMSATSGNAIRGAAALGVSLGISWTTWPHHS